jgi:foldase protein PrsA
MNKLHLIGTAVLAGVMVAGCSKEEEKVPEKAPENEVAQDGVIETVRDPNEVSIDIDGKKLTSGQIDADVEAYIKAMGDQIPENQKAYARQMMRQRTAQDFIVENVLVARAKAEKFVVTEAERKEREAEFIKGMAGRKDAPKSIEEFAEKSPLGKERTLARFENGLLIDKFLKAETEKNKVDYEAQAKEEIAELEKYNAEQPKKDEAALKKIQEIQAELAKPTVTNVPARFAELAEEFSDCPSGKRAGGDLGFFTHGQMVPEFDKVAFTQEVGKVSAPVKTQFGYHLVLVTDKKAAVEAKDDKPAEPESVQASHILIRGGQARRVPTLEEMKRMLQGAGEREAINKVIMDTLQKAKITTSDEFKHLLPEKPEAAEKPAEQPAK